MSLKRKKNELSSSEKSEQSSPNHKKLKESEECSICLKEMTKEQDIRTLGCHDSHKFHKNCIKDALKYKRACPLCREPIDYKERVLRPVPPGASRNDIMNLALRPRLENEDFEDEIKQFVKNNTDRIKAGEIAGQRMPFLGVIVFYRDKIGLKHLKTYLNTELGLTSKSNRYDLRTAILLRAPELAIECPRLTTPRISATKNYLNKSAGVEIFSDNPTFTIDKMYFGTPAGFKENGYAIRNYPSDINADMPYSVSKKDDIRFTPGEFPSNVFTIYNETRPKQLITVEIEDIQFRFFSLEDAYEKYMHKAKTQVMYGREYGLEFPALNDVLDGNPQIAWIIVELGCGYYKNKNTNSIPIGTIYGGKKTRQNKLRRKRNKSQRRNRM